MISWTKALEHFEKIEVKSVTDPLFKYGLGMNLGAGAFAAFGHPQDWVLQILFGLGIACWVIALLAYIYFAIRSPEYLRSETHQQRMRAMDLLGDKENADNPNILNLPAITNPYSKLELDKGTTQSIEG